MSKQRPSTEPAAANLEGATPSSASYWQSRVFKNTYTRAGRCFELKGWSVKIQYQGIRRNYSLSARSRTAAALEAQAIYQTIVRQGWEAVSSGSRTKAHPAGNLEGAGSELLPITDVRYWKRRLLRRRPSSALNLTRGGEFSVRIEHAGESHYFPLGTLNEDAAAIKAREIYLGVVREGWVAINQRCSRELTVALHWTDNPVAWTYTTLQTLIAKSAAPDSVRSAKGKVITRVAIVESDLSLSRALSQCVDRHSGFAATASLGSLRAALTEFARRPPQLVLVDQTLNDNTGHEFQERVRQVAPGLPTLFFSTYEDSDQLFKATPGGASGYLLKRTAPDHLFDPIVGALGHESLTVERIALHVRQYFQALVQSLSAGDFSRDMARLTHREQEILKLLSKGFLDKEIAEALRISVWTVHGHLKKIFEKLDVHTRTEAAIKYLHK